MSFLYGKETQTFQKFTAIRKCSWCLRAGVELLLSELHNTFTYYGRKIEPSHNTGIRFLQYITIITA